MIRVENRRTYKGDGEYVGRPGVLGNPFRLKSCDSRETVIARYKQWLGQQMERGCGGVFDTIQSLAARARVGDLVLICWCAPLPCHADVIKEAILTTINGRSSTPEQRAD